MTSPLIASEPRSHSSRGVSTAGRVLYATAVASSVALSAIALNTMRPHDRTRTALIVISIPLGLFGCYRAGNDEFARRAYEWLKNCLE